MACHLKFYINFGFHSSAWILVFNFKLVSNPSAVDHLYGVTVIKPRVVMTVLVSSSPPHRLCLHYVILFYLMTRLFYTHLSTVSDVKKDLLTVCVIGSLDQ